jgi:hypothetical protein
MNEDNVIELSDDKVLAQSVSDKIEYTMLKDLLIKPLAPVMVSREIQVPIVKETKTDEELAMSDVQEYDEVETKIIEVESIFRKGIVLKVPIQYEKEYEVGDTVVYSTRSAAPFDLLKDSVLVQPFNCVAKVA